MKEVFAQTFPGGRIKVDITSVTLVNNTPLTLSITVPTDTRWIIHGIRVRNPDNVNRDIFIRVYNEVALTNLIGLVFAATVNAAAETNIPNSVVFTQNIYAHAFWPFPLEAGMTITVAFDAGGASAGGVDATGIVILLRELPLS